MSEYVVLARKYRPQKLDDLVGQSAITQTLKNALKLGRMPHALLLTGTRGVGKTTTARILAKALNCEVQEDIEPCDVCSNCLEITKGVSLDVLEIDGASNTSVDDVRQLKENVQYPPVRSKHKIYIIDEVHMLSTSAFNALLKTLEEPPAGVYFIFATTEAHKIPETILSRCQRFDFREISLEQIAQHLHKLMNLEGIHISSESLQMVARGANGSLRDGLSLLDQIIAFSGEEIKEEDVILSLGLTDRLLLDQTLQAFASSDTQAALNTLALVFEKGFDPKTYLTELWEQVRWMFLYKNCGDLSWMQGGTDQAQGLKDLCEGLDAKEIERWFDLIKDTLYQLSRVEFPRYLIEALFVRVTRKVSHHAYAALIEKLEVLEKNLRGHHAPGVSVQHVQSQRAQPSAPPPGPPQTHAPPHGTLKRPSAGSASLPKLFEKLVQTKPQWRPIVASVVRSSWSGAQIKLVFAKTFIFEKASEPGFKTLLESIALEVSGQTASLDVVLEEKKQEGTAPPSRAKANPVKQAPIIQKAISLFDVQGSDIHVTQETPET